MERAAHPNRDASRRRVALVSLGCPKNQVDSELILGRFVAAGAIVVDDPDQADTLVVNTCAFIDAARAESIDALLDAAAWKSARPGRQLIAAGCLVERAGSELAGAMPEIDRLVGIDRIPDVARLVDSPVQTRLPRAAASRSATSVWGHREPRRRLTPPWTAYVKIAEGCDQSCSFCAIPGFRGRMRSRPIEDICAELAALARDGVVEANLVAQDSTGYGRDLGERLGLTGLIRAIDALDECPPWIRLHYLYPGRISERLLAALTDSRRIVEYIDLPLQHADTEILRRMHRPGDADSYLRQLDALRAALPGAGLRSGFIVGFPGETDAAFARLTRFVERAGLDAVGVFAYSREDGTAAGRLSDEIPPDVKRERKAALEEAAAAVAHERNRTRIGSTLEILCEGPADDGLGVPVGRWRGQAPEVDGRVVIRGARTPRAGSLARVTITGAASDELVGTLDDGNAGR